MSPIMRARAVFVFVLLAFAIGALGASRTSILAAGPELKLKSPRMTFMRPRMPNEPVAPRSRSG